MVALAFRSKQFSAASQSHQHGCKPIKCTDKRNICNLIFLSLIVCVYNRKDLQIQFSVQVFFLLSGCDCVTFNTVAATHLNQELIWIQKNVPVSCFDLDLCIAVRAIGLEHSPCAHICFLNTDKEKHRLKKTIRDRKKNVNTVANYVRQVLSWYKHKQFYYHQKGGFSLLMQLKFQSKRQDFNQSCQVELHSMF